MIRRRLRRQRPDWTFPATEAARGFVALLLGLGRPDPVEQVAMEASEFVLFDAWVGFAQ